MAKTKTQKISKKETANDKGAKVCKLLQINLNRSNRAHDLAHAYGRQNGFDVMVACEPNKKRIKGDESVVI